MTGKMEFAQYDCTHLALHKSHSGERLAQGDRPALGRYIEARGIFTWMPAAVCYIPQ